MENINDTSFTTKDHDILIRVEENVKNIMLGIQDMKDGFARSLSDHELRIKKLEDLQIIAKTERKFWGIVGGVLGGIVVAVVTQLLSRFVAFK